MDALFLIANLAQWVRSLLGASGKLPPSPGRDNIASCHAARYACLRCTVKRGTTHQTVAVVRLTWDSVPA